MKMDDIKNKVRSKTKLFKCYSSDLAGDLCLKGFKIISTSPNKTKPQYNTFSLFDTPELHSTIDDYMNNR